MVISLILGFLGGMAFVVGFLKTPWIALTLLLCVVLAAAGLVSAEFLGAALAVASALLGIWSLYGKSEGWSPGRKGSRWNQRTAFGWVVCLLVAGMVNSGRLSAYGPHFKIAGMVIGAAILLLFPRAEVGAKAKG